MHRPFRKLRPFFVLSLLVAVLTIGLPQIQHPAFSRLVPVAPLPIPNATAHSGTIIAELPNFDKLLATGFTPQSDGFNFPNYGNSSGDAKYQALDSSDMIALFGETNVCEGKTKNAAGDCALSKPAEIWLKKQIDSMDEGRCEGMAVASLLLWKNSQTDARLLPGIQSGATRVADLKQQQVERKIAYYFIMQSLREVSQAGKKTRALPPSQLLEQLITSLRSQSDLYTIGIYQRDQSRLTAGHTLAPFAVEKLDNDTYRVHVYDSNFPGEAHYLAIDPVQETWAYQTNVAGQTLAYSGTKNSQNLDLTPLSARLREAGQYTCPFCSDNTPSTPAALEFSLIGEGEVLITRIVNNKPEKQVGFSPDQGQYINKFVSNADLADLDLFRGGLGKDVPPTYTLPILPAAQLSPATDSDDTIANALAQYFVATIFSKYEDQPIDTDAIVIGNDFILGYEGITLEANQAVGFGFSPDGRILILSAAQDDVSPGENLPAKVTIDNLFFAVNAADPAAGSYLFEVGSLELDRDETAVLFLDPAKGKFTYVNQDGQPDEYNLTITQIDSTGLETTVDLGKQTLENGNDASLDFSEWDEEEALNYQEDNEGNGFNDDQSTPIRGQVTKKKKP